MSDHWRWYVDCRSPGMAPRRPPRLKSFSYIGKYQYFVTCCTFERRSVFTSLERVECVRSQILRTCIEFGFDVVASVFMPDHVHLLIQGLHHQSNFKGCMMVSRQRSAHAFRREFHERLWQEGYHDRVLRNADEAAGKIRYIVANPVKAGLCERPEDHPYTYVRRS